MSILRSFCRFYSKKSVLQCIFVDSAYLPWYCCGEAEWVCIEKIPIEIWHTTKAEDIQMAARFHFLSKPTALVFALVTLLTGCYSRSDSTVSGSGSPSSAVSEGRDTETITLAVDYSVYDGVDFEISQPPTLYACSSQTDPCELLSIDRKESTVCYAFHIPDNAQDFTLLPAVIRILQNGDLQTLPAEEGAETADCKVEKIEIAQDAPSAGCKITVTTETKQGWFPYQLFLHNKTNSSSGIASIVFSDTPSGSVLTQCAFVYTLDCSEEQALTILQDSTFQYSVCQRYQYAKNASYSLPEPCSLEIIEVNGTID